MSYCALPPSPLSSASRVSRIPSRHAMSNSFSSGVMVSLQTLSRTSPSSANPETSHLSRGHSLRTFFSSWRKTMQDRLLHPSRKRHCLKDVPTARRLTVGKPSLLHFPPVSLGDASVPALRPHIGNLPPHMSPSTLVARKFPSQERMQQLQDVILHPTFSGPSNGRHGVPRCSLPFPRSVSSTISFSPKVDFVGDSDED